MTTAVDFRNATFAGLRDGLDGARASVYAAWKVYGPGTTRQVAGEAGIDLLSFRPRTTELLQCGLLKVMAGPSGKEGCYTVTSEAEWSAVRGGLVPANGQQVLL